MADLTASQFDDHVWVQFDTMGGVAVEPYQSDREWVLFIDGVIEYVSRGKTDNTSRYAAQDLPLNWEFT